MSFCFAFLCDVPRVIGPVPDCRRRQGNGREFRVLSWTMNEPDRDRLRQNISFCCGQHRLNYQIYNYTQALQLGAQHTKNRIIDFASSPITPEPIILFIGMLQSDSSQGQFFNRTNPKLTFKHHYKKILSGSNKLRQQLKLKNIFDSSTDDNRMMLKVSNPQEFPLGGKKLLEQIRERLEKTDKKILLDSIRDVRRRDETVRNVKPQSCIPLMAVDSRPEERYKSHTKTYASIQNSKKTNTATADASQVFRKDAVSSLSVGRQQNRLARMYDKAESQYFEKVGVQGELEYEEPLEKRYGDRYFEYILRDRYKDDDKRTRAFLYQIRKSNVQPTQNSILQLARKEGYKVHQREYMELMGINKSLKQKYNSCLK